MLLDSSKGYREYEALFRQESARLWRVMYGVVGGRREIAEEAVAEAFARAMERSDRIADPLAWIYRTAFRLAREELRRERRRDPYEPHASSVDSSTGLRDLIWSLRSLSPNQRAAVILRYEEDLTVAEISRVMGISAATVRVHLHRGRNRLREILGSEEVGGD